MRAPPFYLGCVCACGIFSVKFGRTLLHCHRRVDIVRETFVGPLATNQKVGSSTLPTATFPYKTRFLNSAPDIGASGLPQVYLSPRRGISVFPHKAMCGEVEHTFL